jgi:Domain of unknown function (DUF3854)
MQDKHRHPDWSAIKLQGRHCYLCFDSDSAHKPTVRKALLRLQLFLEQQGAIVHVLNLPGGSGSAKVGLDDYLVKHSGEELLALEGTSTTPEPQRPARASSATILRTASRTGRTRTRRHRRPSGVGRRCCGRP